MQMFSDSKTQLKLVKVYQEFISRYILYCFKVTWSLPSDDLLENWFFFKPTLNLKKRFFCFSLLKFFWNLTNITSVTA